MAVVLFNEGHHYCTTIISIDDDIDSDDHGDDTIILYLINIIQLCFIWLTSEYGLFLISSWGCSLKVGSGTTADNSIHIQCAERSIQWVFVVASYIGTSGLIRKGSSHRRRRFRHQSNQPVWVSGCLTSCTRGKEGIRGMMMFECVGTHCSLKYHVP